MIINQQTNKARIQKLFSEIILWFFHKSSTNDEVSIFSNVQGKHLKSFQTLAKKTLEGISD